MNQETLWLCSFSSSFHSSIHSIATIFQGVNLLSREGNGQTGHRMLTANRIRLAAGSKPGITDSDGVLCAFYPGSRSPRSSIAPLQPALQLIE